MKKNNWIKYKSEIKIVSIILVVFLTVVLTGVFAYRGLRSIVADVSHSTRPEMRLMYVRQLVVNTETSETNVKFFNLTHKSEYLKKFFRSTLEIDNVYDSARFHITNTDQLRALEQMHASIEEKYTILNALISFRREGDISNELNTLFEKIKQEVMIEAKLAANRKDKNKINDVLPAEPQTTLTPPLPVPEKKSLFRRLFGKKKETVAEEKKEISASPATATPNTKEIVLPEPPAYQPKELQEILREEITNLNQEYLKKFSTNKQKEFLLTKKSDELSGKIKASERKIEEVEKRLINEKVSNASLQAQKTNWLVASFCVAAGLLLILVCVVLLQYLQKKNNFEKALQMGKQDAENLAKAKEVFLANMSHEIRTPMHAIAGFTDQVLKTDLKPQQREQLQIVERTTSYLLHIVNEILDYSKMEAGKIKFAALNFNLPQLVEEVHELSRGLLKEKTKLKCEVITNQQDYILGDPWRLKQILINVISNALKFTEKGEVVVKVEAKKEEDIVMLQVLVSDTGIGIPPDKLQRVFGEFQQADDKVYEKYGGTGLGLAITKKIIDLQRGTIKIDSKEGQGTKVHIQLPFQLPDPENNIYEAIHYPQDNYQLLSQLNILVADDDEYNRKLLQVILNKWNIKYTEVNNGKEAVEQVRSGIYSLVLMDVRMPLMDGLQATQKIRSLKEGNTSHIPIIALTAAASEDKWKQCKEVGMDDIISKPFTEEELLNKLLVVMLGTQTERMATNTSAKENNTPPEMQQLYNLSELKKASGGNMSFFADMIELFMKTSTEGLEKMKQAFKQENVEEMSALAHKMAPACKQLEATGLYFLLKKMENETQEQRKDEHVAVILGEVEQQINSIINGLQQELTELKNNKTV